MQTIPQVTKQPSRVVVLSGGMGGAKFLQGLKHLLPHARITVVANTCDDMWVHGLRVCPDLDTVMYTLGDGIDRERGWGRTDETWSAKADLEAYGAGLEWFGLGDRDIATHLVRTTMLRAGQSLTEATARLCERWQPGVDLLPMTNDEVETHVVVQDGEGRRTIHFQEYWVRLRAQLPALELIFSGLAQSTPAPGVLQAIAAADLVILPPSNPVVSVGTILGVPGIVDALRATSAPVVGLSPIVGGSHVRGMAEQMLASIGVEVSAAAVGLHYGSRTAGGVLDGWLVDTVDADGLVGLEAAGIKAAAVPLWMTDLDTTAAMAQAAIDLVGTREAIDVSLALTQPGRVTTIVGGPYATEQGVQKIGGGTGAEPGTDLRNAARQGLVDAAARGDLRTRVVASYPLDQAVEAHRFVAEGHAAGKVVLLP